MQPRMALREHVRVPLLGTQVKKSSRVPDGHRQVPYRIVGED